MRIAALVVGLVLTLGVFIQSVAASAVSDLSSDQNLKDAAGWGFLLACAFLLASALVVAKPRFSMWTFAACAIVGVAAGASSAFRDLIFYGCAAIVLAFLAWRGSIEKRRRDVREAERDAAIASLAGRDATPAT